MWIVIYTLKNNAKIEMFTLQSNFYIFFKKNLS
jgi:hypothetical protein